MVMNKRQYITWNYEGSIVILEINNPPLNILTDLLLTELNEVLDLVCKSSNCRAIVIKAAGDKAFVAGADISQFDQLTKEEGQALLEKGKAVFDKLTEIPIPVICSVNELALGGGLELALACDIRVADMSAKLAFPETSLGIIPGYGGTQRLARLIGAGKAKKILFTNELVHAREAYEIGLIEEVTPVGESFNVAMRLARKIASNAPQAIRLVKAVIDQGVELGLEEGQRLETNYFIDLCETEDMVEGVRAFAEKRSPVFTGK